jgi:hypothetical protein
MAVSTERRLYNILEVVLNSLQTAVLSAERVRDTSSAVAKESRILIRSLKRATTALRQLQPRL